MVDRFLKEVFHTEPFDWNALLTPREREIMRLFALGKTWNQVRYALGVAKSTVASDLSSVYLKLDADCREDVYRKLGWLKVPGD